MGERSRGNMRRGDRPERFGDGKSASERVSERTSEWDSFSIFSEVFRGFRVFFFSTFHRSSHYF